jgi:putative nucleotidyltransferase with HDIG domain
MFEQSRLKDKISVNLVYSEPLFLAKTTVKRMELLRMDELTAKKLTRDRALETLYEVGNLVNAENDLKKVLDAILEAVTGHFAVDRAVLFLADKGDLLPQVVWVTGKAEASIEFTVSRTIVRQSIDRGDSILSRDATLDERFKGMESVIANQIRAVMCVPMHARNQVVGAIYVDNLGKSAVFEESDMDLLTAVGKQAGVAIERARLYEGLKALFYRSLRTLVSAIEARDRYTSGHSENVTIYAEQLAEELGYSTEFQEKVRLAGLLHDIGKLGIPEQILFKPDLLTPEEYETIKTHPVIGARIVANLPDIKTVLLGVKHHHEFFDGTGYPDMLRGEEIPLIARIVKVADAYDAMNSERPYRGPLSLETILDELGGSSDAEFDSRISGAMCQLLREQRLRKPEPTIVRHALFPEALKLDDLF